MSLTFSPISACAGNQPFAECHGVDLSKPLNTDVTQALRTALLEHGLLLFRDQQAMTPTDEVAFNRAFGWHDAEQRDFLFGFGAPVTEHRVSGGAQMPGLPEVSVLGNVFLEDYHGITNTQLVPVLGFSHSGWHADGLHDMFDGLPEMTTMFNPSGWSTLQGGQTYFTSGPRALSRMEPELLEELSRCVVGYMRYPNDDAQDDNRRVAPGASVMEREGTYRVGFAIDRNDHATGLHDFELRPEHADAAGRHPCIYRHPVTDEHSLYITPGQAVCLLDAKTGQVRHNVDETTELLSEALLPSALPDIRYEHAWREGDFVAWINTLVLHSASDPSGIDGPRLMHRVRLSTPKTRWAAGLYLDFPANA
ncbi:MAG: hypothetical protein HOI34_14605 [Rhodospirillaceae bacterium]|jgi:alpha-ketoglutarate-dependent taurine dioxygenase|nr:hypothetical protein [Rhodospirillaceae bacterium]MBT6511898.1 hypothetical protein [Rhodospirillaceae bacterium]MBT7614112.1 hypothetical protein [Rhodospirillaceae bacterium]MBT7648934.1 hypothetical protein [Rhodospirillaceae bacterium]